MKSLKNKVQMVLANLETDSRYPKHEKLLQAQGMKRLIEETLDWESCKVLNDFISNRTWRKPENNPKGIALGIVNLWSGKSLKG